MMPLDDRLRDLFESSGPAADELRGDLRQVQARVRQRALRRRAVVGAVAAAILAGGAFLLVLGDPGGDDVRTDLGPVTEPRVPITTATDRSTSDRPGSTVGATTTSTSSTSTSSTSSSTSTTSPPGPSIRDVALGEATYASACPAYDDAGRSATLSGGAASLPAGDGATLQVSVDAVGYGDADGDGDEDAVLLLRCTFAGASTDLSGELRAYRVGPGGGIEQIGSSHLLAHPKAPHEATADGMSVTVDLDVYGADDPLCCPSSGARETWRFDGTGFVLAGSTPIPAPGAG